MESTTSQILKELRKIGSKIVKKESNYDFLVECQKKHQTSKGFIRKCNVTTEDSELYQDCQDIQDAASWKIQCKVIEKLPKEIKQLKNNFKKIKAGLFLNCKNRASSLYMKVRKEMNRLSDKLKR